MLKGEINAKITIRTRNSFYVKPVGAEFIVEDWGRCTSEDIATQEAYLEEKTSREIMRMFLSEVKRYAFDFDTKVSLTDYSISYREVHL